MRKVYQALVLKGAFATLRPSVLIGMGVMFALTVSHAIASDAASQAGQTVSEVPATQPRAAKDPGQVRPPRPRPAGPAKAGGAVGTAQSDQCRWLGTRIVSLLSRDDAMTAENFNPFYERFGCPEAHLSDAFGCVVGGSGQTQGEELASRVDRCWADPVDGRTPKNVVDDGEPAEDVKSDEDGKENSAGGGT